MEIKLDLNAGKVPPTTAAKPAARASQVAKDATEFTEAESLEKALARTPDIRPEVVDNAKRLVGDLSYPPRETLQRIAVLLAMPSEP